MKTFGEHSSKFQTHISIDVANPLLELFLGPTQLIFQIHVYGAKNAHHGIVWSSKKLKT